MKVAKTNYCRFLFTIILLALNPVLSIRFPDRIASNQPLQTAVFALGSFWRSEASFGCFNGIVRTTVGYAGGSKANPEYRNLADHAECVQVEYDPRVIGFRQLLEVFWASHDSRQVFGQGPDVGNQYRSIIFASGTEESRLAAVSKEREQSKSKSSIVTTQIQQLEAFYPAEPEHQIALKVGNKKSKQGGWCVISMLTIFIAIFLSCKRRSFLPNDHLKHMIDKSLLSIYQKFELKRNPFLLQLMGTLPEEEFERSTLATKLNGYAAELCPSRIQKRIDAKINDIIKKGWPILREV